jgi:type I restriction enzyme M protein
MLFINASEHFEKGKRQNRLRDGEDSEPNDIEKIVSTYKDRIEENVTPAEYQWKRLKRTDIT